MPYNAFGDLYKSEIVTKLQQMGYQVKNVHQLNLIMEEIGLQIHDGGHWLTTKAGVKYTIYSSQVFDADAWHPSVINLICDFLNS